MSSQSLMEEEASAGFFWLVADGGRRTVACVARDLLLLLAGYVSSACARQERIAVVLIAHSVSGEWAPSAR